VPIEEREQQGSKYWYVDYPNLSEPKCIELIEAYAQRLEHRQQVLAIYDYTGATIGTSFMARAKELGKKVAWVESTWREVDRRGR
jgi:hypothetical protein